MKLWDMNTGVSRLEDAMESLKKATARIETEWDDDTFRKFQETWLAPLEPRARRATDAVQRLAQVLARAERECASY